MNVEQLETLFMFCRAMMDMANERMDKATDQKMDMVIGKMFQQTHTEDADGIRFEDFMKMVETCGTTLESAKLTLNIDSKFSKTPLRTWHVTLGVH